MLRGIRKASSNWLGKAIMMLVMGVIILSFAVWGVADIFKGYGASTLAKIGNTEITTEQFRQLYTEKLQQIGRQIGRPLSSEQARSYGFDRQVLQQVVAEATLDEGARRMGLAQSDADVVKQIQADPNFAGLNGQFDAQRFAYTIRQYGYSEQRYLAEQRKVSVRRQIAGTVTAGVEPSKTQLEALLRYQSEQRSVDYIRLGADQAGTIDPPSPEALAAFYDDRKVSFRAPEYRKLAVLTLTPEQLAGQIQVSDDEARKLFEDRRTTYSTPEKRQLSQIVFPTADEAKTARERIVGGLAFDDLAKERSLSASDIDLGIVAKSAVIDPAVADAAFALADGEISEPVAGRFGTVLVRVGKIEAGFGATYESVADGLKRELAVTRARASVQELHNKVEDERGGGANIAEAATKLGLTAITIEAIDRSGRGPDGQLVSGLPRAPEVLTGAFASNIGVENELQQFEGGYLWFDVLGVTPSRERALDEVKDQVASRWRDEQIGARLRAKATDIVEKIEKGSTLAAEASAAGVDVATLSDVRRDAKPSDVPGGVIETAFRTAKDTIAQTQGETGGERIVLRVTNVTVPSVDLASDTTKKLKSDLQRAQGEEQIGQYVGKLESVIGSRINAQAFAVATGAASAN